MFICMKMKCFESTCIYLHSRPWPCNGIEILTFTYYLTFEPTIAYLYPAWIMWNLWCWLEHHETPPEMFDPVTHIHELWPLFSWPVHCPSEDLGARTEVLLRQRPKKMSPVQTHSWPQRYCWTESKITYTKYIIEMSILSWYLNNSLEGQSGDKQKFSNQRYTHLSWFQVFSSICKLKHDE